jgi:hypothetical protein
MHSYANQNYITTGLKYHINEADQHEKKLKEKPNTQKELNTGSTKLPLPVATQLYRKTLYTQSGGTYAQITKQNYYVPTNIEQEPHINQSHQQTSNKHFFIPFYLQFVLVHSANYVKTYTMACRRVLTN